MYLAGWQTTFTCCLKVTVVSFVPQAPEHAFFQEHNYGDRSFAARTVSVDQPAISLVRQSEISYNDFKRQLKTFLFG